MQGRKGRVECGAVSLCLRSPGAPLFSDAASGSTIPAFRTNEAFLQISETSRYENWRNTGTDLSQGPSLNVSELIMKSAQPYYSST